MPTRGETVRLARRVLARAAAGGKSDDAEHGRVQRAKAEQKVAGKVIKATGASVMDAQKAADHEMRRVAKKEKVHCLRPSPFGPNVVDADRHLTRVLGS